MSHKPLEWIGVAPMHPGTVIRENAPLVATCAMPGCATIISPRFMAGSAKCRFHSRRAPAKAKPTLGLLLRSA
ncbi:MAG: hypothetical protein WEE66_13655 [Actinomycetota bacterium]